MQIGFFNSNKRIKIAAIVIFVVLFIDQALKVWIKTSMRIGDEFSVFGNWFLIHFIENNGMAFGMELGGEIGKLALSLFRIVAVFVIAYYLFKISKKESTPIGLIVAVALIFAGALGNIIDSAVYGLLFSESYTQIATFMPENGGYAGFLHGKVVDMLYFPIIEGRFPSWFPIWANESYLFFRPVFNIADSSITIGIGLIILFQKRFFGEENQLENKITE